MKIRAAKALTAAVVIGGTLFATGGTSFAAHGLLPVGAAVTAGGRGATAEGAESEATLRAEDKCESEKVTTGSYDTHLTNGTWTSTYTGNCASASPRRGGDRR